ncbi:hypothetical protein QZH41_000283 [Actinostola sp. cb2023]|nr:hypothetical protein QZH41_000283 [Actinostola sp. cb2023]
MVDEGRRGVSILRKGKGRIWYADIRNEIDAWYQRICIQIYIQINVYMYTKALSLAELAGCREGKLSLQNREGEWDRRLGLGNPAAGKVVKDYLRLVTAEQLQARISPRQAMPFFVDKLVQLSSHLHKALESPGVTPLQRFILARDQAYLKAVFFSGDRPGDMGQELASQLANEYRDNY